MQTGKLIGRVNVSESTIARATDLGRSYHNRRTATATLRAGIGRLALGLSGALLAAGMLAGPVGAAGSTTSPDVRACLTWGGVAYANQPVFLMRYNASALGWEKARQATTNSNGCVRWNDLATNRWFQVVGYRVFWNGYYYYSYYGESPVFKTVANDHLFNYSIYVSGPYPI